LEADLKSVSGTITSAIEGSPGASVAFKVEHGDELVFNEVAPVNGGVAKVQFHVKEPKLWYPHGYGDQALYKFTATLSADGTDLHETSRRTGFRKGQLVQERDEVGKSFFFRINGVDVFCGGSDWIPADSFTPRVSADRYRKWLEMMVDGHQVMIRYGLTRVHVHSFSVRSPLHRAQTEPKP
jgi:beta-mannosidase